MDSTEHLRQSFKFGWGAQRRRTPQVTPALIVGALISGCTAPHVSLPLLPPFPPTAAPAVLWTESFDALQPQLWRHVEVHGHTSYEGALLEDRRCLKAHSEGAASMLLRQARFDPKTYPWISWDWRGDWLLGQRGLGPKGGAGAPPRARP